MKPYIKFFESTQSDRAIRQLTDTTLEQLAVKLNKRIEEGQFNPEGRNNLKIEMFEMLESGALNKLNDFDFLSNFIQWAVSKDFDIILTTDKSSTGGEYRTKEQRIVIFNVLFPNTWLKGYRHFEGEKEIHDHFKTYYKTVLTHEFQHAYDDFISKGKFMPKKYKGFPKSAEDVKGLADYAKQNLEVNARYSAWIADHERERILLSWPAYLNEFKQSWGLEYLTTAQFKRLINRLHAQYNESLPENFKTIALNNSSFKVFQRGEINHNKDYLSISDKRWKGELTDNDLLSYMKQTVDNILTGKYDPKEIKDLIINNNRYRGLNAIKYSIGAITQAEESLSKHKDDPDMVRILTNEIKTEKEYLNKIKKMFNITDEDLQTIDQVMRNL